jgi:glutamyl/glutaminyl-tRNA synthetase
MLRKFASLVVQRRYHKEVKTRFAPSPTGFMHLGALRTALYSYLFAKQNNGKFVLRIEDTDQKRSIEGSIEQIKSTLQWVNIKIDEFYVQSERKEKYQQYANELIQVLNKINLLNNLERSCIQMFLF